MFSLQGVRKMKKRLYLPSLLLVLLSVSMLKAFRYELVNRTKHKVEVTFRVGKKSASQKRIVNPETVVLLIDSMACLKEIRAHDLVTRKRAKKQGYWCGDTLFDVSQVFFPRTYGIIGLKINAIARK